MEHAPDRHVEHVLRTMTAQFGAHSSSVWRQEESSGLIGFQFALEDNRFVTQSDALRSGLGVLFSADTFWSWPTIIRTKLPNVVEDIREVREFPFRERLISMGIVTILVVPMLIAGRVDGVISVRFVGRRAFRAEEIELAQALAHQAMLAMQLTRLSAQSRDSAVIAERNRMARDIHDTLAQGFTGVIVQLEAAEDARIRGLAHEADGHLMRAKDLARESLKEARHSVQALRPQLLEESDLCAALDKIFKRMTAGTRLRCDFAVQGEPRALPRGWDENLLRIGQEVLTNAVRHARASHFIARLAFTPDEVRLDLSDDGLGFDPAGRSDGYGLRGIEERVEGMHGRLTIRSAKGRGTTVSIRLPTAQRAAAALS
jgi:signal transduction histidine kinase